MAMSMDWYGCSFYTRLGKTAVNSILFATVPFATVSRQSLSLIRDGDMRPRLCKLEVEMDRVREGGERKSTVA